MENKTKDKHQSALEQYVDFLLQIPKGEYPFIAPLKKSVLKKEEQTNKVDSCLYNSEGIVYKGILYTKNKIGYRAISDYEGIEKGTTSFLKKHGGTEYLFKGKDGVAVVVGHGLLWKTRFEKLINTNHINVDLTKLGTPYKIREDLTPTAKSKGGILTGKLGNLVHDEPGDISNDTYDNLINSQAITDSLQYKKRYKNAYDSYGVSINNPDSSWREDYIKKEADIQAEKDIENEKAAILKMLQKHLDVNKDASKHMPARKTYDLVNVYTFSNDFVIDKDTNEFIPKGESTYRKGRTVIFEVKSNLGVCHKFTEAALMALVGTTIKLTKEIRQVNNYDGVIG